MTHRSNPPLDKNVANKINVSAHAEMMVCDGRTRQFSSKSKRMYAGQDTKRANILEVHADRRR